MVKSNLDKQLIQAKSGTGRKPTAPTPSPVQLPSALNFQCPLIPLDTGAVGSSPETSPPAIVISFVQGQFVFRINRPLLIQLQSRLEQTTDAAEPPTLSSFTPAYRLEIPYGLAQQLRQAALFDTLGYIQSGLTFCTHYSDPLELEPEQAWVSHSRRSTWLESSGRYGQRVFRTVLALDGDIIHQITEDCLKSSNCRALVSLHFWLVEQLLDRLQLQSIIYLNLAFNVAPKLITGTTALANLPTFFSHPAQAIGTIAFSSLSFLLPVLWRRTRVLVLRWLLLKAIKS